MININEVDFDVARERWADTVSRKKVAADFTQRIFDNYNLPTGARPEFERLIKDFLRTSLSKEDVAYLGADIDSNEAFESFLDDYLNPEPSPYC